MTAASDKAQGLTIEHLRDAISYDPATGHFHWNAKVNQVDGKAGWVNPKTGYVIIKVYGHKYMAHRLAWFYVYGVWPDQVLDHINCDPADNRLVNLREADNERNSANRRKNRGKTLAKGVSKHFGGGYVAKINAKYIGIYPTEQLAQAAYENAAVARYGEFARVA